MSDVDPVREASLAAADLAMIATASRYDLTDPHDMRRSVDDLRKLFFQLSRVIRPDLFLEAGAKDAETSRRAHRRLDPERIVAFEANPYTYKRFARGFARKPDGVEYLHLALSDVPGTVSFNVNLTADGRPVSDGQGSLFRHELKATAVTEVSVEATTLDTFFDGSGFESCACWVDVEGALRQVLTGGRATFERACTVLVEVEDRHMWGEDQWLREDVVGFFADCGLIPVARDFQSRYQYNIVFVRRSLFESIHTLRWTLAMHHSQSGGGRTKSIKSSAKKSTASKSAASKPAASKPSPSDLLPPAVRAQVRRLPIGWRRRARRLMARL